MRILIVSPYFHPENISTGRYNTVLAQELVRHGATVDVLASHPLYPSWRPVHSDKQLPGMEIRRGGLWVRYPAGQALRRAVIESWFAAYVAMRLVLRKHAVDRVVVVFPPVCAAIAIRWFMPRRVRKIGVVHDLQGVLARNRWVRFVARLLEGRALAACDRLIFLSRSMADRAIALYGLDPDKTSVRYPFLTLECGESSGESLAGILPKGYLHVVYSGALGEKQEPEKLYRLLDRLAARNQDLRCHIFSAGPKFDQLRASAAGGGRVGFHALVPEHALGELYARSTIQIIPQARGTGDGALPSKLPNLIAAGVPVFMICDAGSEAATLLDQAGHSAGCCATDFDSEDTLVRFDGFVDEVLQQARQDRVMRQREFVERMFRVTPLFREILED
jgi:colanic acid biosynthesis glycosyl transferase WcaI